MKLTLLYICSYILLPNLPTLMGLSITLKKWFSPQLSNITTEIPPTSPLALNHNWLTPAKTMTSLFSIKTSADSADAKGSRHHKATCDKNWNPTSLTFSHRVKSLCSYLISLVGIDYEMSDDEDCADNSYDYLWHLIRRITIKTVKVINRKRKEVLKF